MSGGPEHARDRRRYVLMNAARLGGLGLVMLGFAITRDLVPLPFAAGAVLAVAGLLGFFFAPPLLAKRWKAQDYDHS